MICYSSGPSIDFLFVIKAFQLLFDVLPLLPCVSILHEFLISSMVYNIELKTVVKNIVSVDRKRENGEERKKMNRGNHPILSSSPAK